MKKTLLIIFLFLSVVSNGQGFFWSYSRVFRNAQLCDYFTKNNCASKTIAVPTQACVSAGHFISGISQADADAKAHEFLYHTDFSGFEGFGQYAANNFGTCDPIPAYFYNWYAAYNVKNIANTGWKIPIDTDWMTLIEYVDTSGDPYLYSNNKAGGYLKSTGYTYWNTPNTQATNSVGFNAKGLGWRDGTGPFVAQKSYLFYWTQTNFDNAYYKSANRMQNTDSVYYVSKSYNGAITQDIRRGFPARLVKESTSLTNGQTGTYTGNDGTTYATICIGTQEWLSTDLLETKYRDGTSIPEVVPDASWAALTTGARSYDNTTEPAPPPTAPTVTTTAVYAITSTTATSGGNITSDGGASVTDRGVCWGASANPTFANSWTNDGANSGTFVSSITGLIAGTTYHVRAYAINSAGTSYGSDVAFTTLPSIYVTLNYLAVYTGKDVGFQFTHTNTTASSHTIATRFKNTTTGSAWFTQSTQTIYANSSQSFPASLGSWQMAPNYWSVGNSFEVQVNIDSAGWVTTNIIAPGNHVLNYP